MSLVAGVLLFLSAITHAGWNFLSKKDHPTLAFYFVANTIGVLCVLPILPFYWDKIVLVPGKVWIYVNLSGFFLAAYMASLAGAYRSGDLSIAYPIARSMPAIFVTFATIAFGLGEGITLWFVLGVFCIVSGCIMLPMHTYRHFKIGVYFNLCCLLAVVAAIFIAGYTIVDHQALSALRSLPGIPFSPIDATLLYMVLEAVSTSLWKGIFVIVSAEERRRIRDVLLNFKASAALTGIGIYLTYGLVLASMNYVSNVSYVAAFRQLSIPIGALFGMVFLREQRYLPKVMGIILIFSGLVLAAMQ